MQAMDLQHYIQQFSLAQIIDIEHTDTQFVALRDARKKINDKNKDSQELFVYLVIQNALISYQVAGSGPQRRQEFADKIVTDFMQLQKLQKNNTDWRYEFLTTSRYNKRLYNLKRKRLEKLQSSHFIKGGVERFISFYDNMNDLHQLLADAMQQKAHNKTITFAVKMYGYAARIVTNKFIHYPMNIPIPIDSRLTKIYRKHNNDVTLSPSKGIDQQTMHTFFQQLSEKYNIPPLHLDSLLWIDYWEKWM